MLNTTANQIHDQANHVPDDGRSDAKNQVTLVDFLNHVLPADGVRCYVTIKNGIPSQWFCDTNEELARSLMEIDQQERNVYFAAQTYKVRGNRTGENVLKLKSFRVDVDTGKGKPYAAYDDALAALRSFCVLTGLPMPTVVCSGNGVHAYWVMVNEMEPEAWLPVAERLQALAANNDLNVDVKVTTDRTRILRPINTRNWKDTKNPKQVYLDGDLQPPIPNADFLSVIDKVLRLRASAKASTLNEDVVGGLNSARPDFPPSFAAIAITKCREMQRFRDSRGNVSEPEWYAHLGVLGHSADGEKLAQEWSSGYDGYDEAETEKKLQQAHDRAGPTTCAKFRSFEGNACAGCPHKVTSPIMLGRVNPPGAVDDGHVEIAQAVISRIGDDNLIYQSDRFWMWQDKGVWEAVDDKVIQKIVLDVGAGKKLTKNLIASVLEIIKIKTYDKAVQLDKNTSIINCLNGELHLVDGGWELRQHNKRHYQTTLLPVAYDPKATCPRFAQFLGEVFSGDADKKEKIYSVCQMMGYSLIKTCQFEKFVLLIGEGSNGKSVLLAIVAALLGVSNIAAVQPSMFDNRFQRGHLLGKLANIVTEIAEGAEIADAQLKFLVSGELTTAEHKFKPPFNFKPYATMWFGTNHMPHTRDFSDALFRRAIILGFNNKFEGEKQDVRLTDKLLTELPGIFNLALSGLLNLHRNKGFTTCPSSDAAKLEWRREADQTSEFIEDKCVLEKGATVLSSTVYEAYRIWADANGIAKKLSRKGFTKRLKRYGITPHKGAKGGRYLEGVTLRPLRPGP